jgi:formylglycine-generating enzyme
MNRIKNVLLILLISSASPLVMAVIADTFGSGANSFDIDFITIGNPNNPPDANANSAPGSVAYSYRIGRFEISEQMIDNANSLGGLNITHDPRGPDYPATSITWFEAAKFVNWLNTSTGHSPAYKFDASGNFQLWQPTDAGYDTLNLYRNKLAVYVLPSIHEWHKAAFYDPSRGAYYTYTTSSDSTPDGIDSPGDPQFDAVFYDGGLNSLPNLISDVGLPAPYGTFGQGGNVDEWLETASDFGNSAATDQRIQIGGSWVDDAGFLSSYGFTSGAPNVERPYTGFRIASVVPEPTVLSISFIGFALITAVRRKRREINVARTNCAT